MHKNIMLCLLLVGNILGVVAQEKAVIQVLNQQNEPVSEAFVYLENKNYLTDDQGKVSFAIPSKNQLELHISHLEYEALDTIIPTPKAGEKLIFQLRPNNLLDEILITGRALKMTPISKVVVDRDYVHKNFEGSLAKSLEKLPGVQSIGIGGGMSKPLIRGLGFNRIVVTQNGNKLEGQQWGVDHGLEVDAFGAEEVEILKGANALAYGSDAIGGVLKIKNNAVPEEEGISGNWNGFGKSVNKALGTSVGLQYKKEAFFGKIRLTGLEYGDYKTTTRSIDYIGYEIPIYDKIMKNTAGREYNWNGQIGYTHDGLTTSLSVGNVFQKSGFFPGSHGIPALERVQPDGSHRNIEFPYQQVDHFTLNSNTDWRIDRHQLALDMAYQRNHRQEWSLFHTHYSGQPQPDKNPDLEMDFLLETFDFSLKDEFKWDNVHSISVGIQGQTKENKIAGYGFLLPEYSQRQIGAFGIYTFKPSSKSLWITGIRYDRAHLRNHSFFDPYLETYLLEDLGKDEQTAYEYALRSAELKRDFSAFNFNLGWAYDLNHLWDFQINTGTNFRFPTPIELGANGIHHGSFRHEKGDPKLKPEKGWVVDMTARYQNENWGLETAFSPYLHYFTNYIFIRPSGSFSLLPHSGQIYEYTQSRALHTGFEWTVHKDWGKQFHTELTAEYIFNQQLTKDRARNYPLPFTPANNLFLEATYLTLAPTETNHPVEIAAYARLIAKQDRIAQGEPRTDGAEVYGLSLQKDFDLGKKIEAHIKLSVDNLLNRKYISHTSFYRDLGIPEEARNFQLMLGLKF